MAGLKCARCPAILPPGRKLRYCYDCNREYMRDYVRPAQVDPMAPSKEFPGVDIDRIHRIRRA